MLIVDPLILTFKKSGNETIGTVSLKNAMADKNLSYKVRFFPPIYGYLSMILSNITFSIIQIKTTSPEKFKVRPTTGILQGSQKIGVMITMQPGYNSQNLLPNDRFLIMCLPIKDEKLSAQDLIDFWKVCSIKNSLTNAYLYEFILKNCFISRLMDQMQNNTD